MGPSFLTLGEVLEIHRDQISRFGGAQGIRDMELLKSALGMPETTFGGQYLHSDLFEISAAYLFHIIRNHPFIDGNKRTGTVAALIFLLLNEVNVQIPENRLIEMVLSVACGECAKSEIAAFLRKYVIRV